MIDCKGGGNNWLLNNDQFDNLITNSLKLHTTKLPVCFVKITILIGGGIFEMLDLPSRFHEMNNFSGWSNIKAARSEISKWIIKRRPLKGMREKVTDFSVFLPEVHTFYQPIKIDKL